MSTSSPANDTNVTLHVSTGATTPPARSRADVDSIRSATPVVCATLNQRSAPSASASLNGNSWRRNRSRTTIAQPIRPHDDPSTFSAAIRHSDADLRPAQPAAFRARPVPARAETGHRGASRPPGSSRVSSALRHQRQARRRGTLYRGTAGRRVDDIPLRAVFTAVGEEGRTPRPLSPGRSLANASV